MLLEKLKKYEILLASNSPRRRNLIRELGFNVRILDNPAQEEIYPPEMNAKDVPEYLAKEKGKNISVKNNQVLVTADTIVILNNEPVGKPVSKKEAAFMLERLSGKMHEVVTGMYLRSHTTESSFSVLTRVYFGKLLKEEIEYYINNYQPLDKAGAYGIQEWIGYIGVERIEGSYYNVMGLPVQALYHELCRHVSF
ncbi:MAG: Maf family nucleotide pyrophosphatase [bacterium]